MPYDLEASVPAHGTYSLDASLSHSLVSKRLAFLVGMVVNHARAYILVVIDATAPYSFSYKYKQSNGPTLFLSWLLRSTIDLWRCFSSYHSNSPWFDIKGYYCLNRSHDLKNKVHLILPSWHRLPRLGGLNTVVLVQPDTHLAKRTSAGSGVAWFGRLTVRPKRPAPVLV